MPVRVDSGLASGLITRPRSSTNVCKIHSSRLILMGNRPGGLIRKVQEEKRNVCCNIWIRLKKRNTSPSKLAQAATLLTCVREAPGSNIGLGTNHPE
jgi:hypothetical protein